MKSLTDRLVLASIISESDRVSPSAVRETLKEEEQSVIEGSEDMLMRLDYLQQRSRLVETQRSLAETQEKLNETLRFAGALRDHHNQLIQRILKASDQTRADAEAFQQQRDALPDNNISTSASLHLLVSLIAADTVGATLERILGEVIERPDVLGDG